MKKLKNIYVYLRIFGFTAWINKIISELSNIIGVSKPSSSDNFIEKSHLDPWIIDYDERVSQLDKGQIKVAYYYGMLPDSSSYRYRVYNMVKVLQQSKVNISASFFHYGDLDKLTEIVNSADILVVCRSAYSDKLYDAITLAKKRGKKVIYDIDDLVFDSKYVHLVLDTIGADIERDDTWNYWYGYFSRNGAALLLCDKVITTNDFLAEIIRGYSSKIVNVIPNFLNQEQLEISRLIYQEKRENPRPANRTIYMGYFSGTRTHNLDFKIITSALIEIFEKYENIKLRIVGELDLDEKLKAYSNRIELYPIQNYIDLQRFMAEVDINLIPLQDNAFTNCKSELKYFEAGIVGTISIASPTYVFRNAIQDGHNGFLAGPDEWAQKIEELLAAFNQYPRIAENAFQDAEQHYSCENMGSVIENALLT